MSNLKQTSLVDCLKRKSSGEEESAKRSKCAKPVNWRDTLREDYGLQWISAGPEIRAGCPSLYVLYTESRALSKKFAVFDMDWTLVKPKSGGKWPKGEMRNAGTLWIVQPDNVP